MKKTYNIPCFPGWVCAGVCFVLALIPNYFYVRLMPGLIGLVTAGYCGISIYKKRKPAAGRVLWWLLTSLVMIGVLIFTVTGGLILHSAQGQPDADCPYIIVLGAQVNPDGPSASLQERIDTAYDYLITHPQATAIVSGGKGDDEHISEALCMFRELTDMGIQADRVIKEESAASTWANLSYSLDIIQQRTGVRPDRVGVVSSEYHLFRTALQAKDHGLTIVGIPAQTGSFHRFAHYFIREIAGVWHYLLLGGQYQ